MTKIIFTRILTNYLNHEKFFAEDNSNSKPQNKRSKKNSLNVTKNKIESVNSINLRKSLLQEKHLEKSTYLINY